jgi:hypothetical protein
MPVLARSGGRVFFTATDIATGYELWRLPAPARFHTVVPFRVADTRDPAGPTGGVLLGASERITLSVAGRCGIPSAAISVAANVTVVNPTLTGTLSFFAGGPIVSRVKEVPVTAGKTRALNVDPRHRRLALCPCRSPAGGLDARPPRRERLVRVSRKRVRPSTGLHGAFHISVRDERRPWRARDSHLEGPTPSGTAYGRLFMILIPNL